jgi:predicted Zn-dependent protease
MKTKVHLWGSGTLGVRFALPFIIGLALAIAALPNSAAAHQPVMLGPMLLGYDLDDLPQNPSIAQQVDAGQKQLAVIREDNPTLDSNAEVVEYFNAIAKKLIAASQPPPFPITVHVPSEQIMNAQALPGGVIVLYENLFDETQSESELVAVLAHETAHQFHNDFLKFWQDYKSDPSVYGKDGVLEQSQGIEAAADDTGAHMMYAAGWDPRGMVHFLEAMHSLGVRARRGEPSFRSTHPRDRERIASMEQLVAKLPPKQGLIADSSEFQRLKRKY